MFNKTINGGVVQNSSLPNSKKKIPLNSNRDLMKKNKISEMD